MDLYGDLPAAVGAAMALDAEDKTKTSSVWAKGVPGFAPATASKNAPVVNTKTAILPASLATAYHKSPDAAAAKANVNAMAKVAGRGVSLAFRPASITRKAPPSTSTSAFTSQPRKEKPAPVNATKQEHAPRSGLGFVAATTWTQVAVGKENLVSRTSTSSTTSDPVTDTASQNAQFFQATYRDEYHPSRPNSYEVYCHEREAKQKLEQVKRDLDRRQREQEREAKREREQLVKDLNEGKAPSISIPMAAGRGRGMTVPAWMKKKIEATSSTASSVAPQRVEIDATSDQFADAEPRGGLGFKPHEESTSRRHSSRDVLRDEFGRDITMRVPDQRDSFRRRSHSRSRDRAQQSRADAESSARKQVIDSQAMSNQPRGGPRAALPQGRVVLLQNMVGPGEVDEELQEEVKEECSTKYGAVTKCIVHERHGRVHSEEAVRIFVEFAAPASAIQAMQGLNSRFFGGRRVKATLYDDAKFARLDLNG